jgi:hypothetical protein
MGKPISARVTDYGLERRIMILYVMEIPIMAASLILKSVKTVTITNVNGQGYGKPIVGMITAAMGIY